MFMFILVLPWACAALSSFSTTTTTKSPRKTSDLPTLALTANNNVVYEYSLTVNQTNQQINLRLDVQDGHLWVPGDSGFTSCPDDDDLATETATGGKICAYNGVYTMMENNSDAHYYSTDSHTEVDIEEQASQLDVYLANYISVQGAFVEDSLDFNITDSQGSSSVENLFDVVMVATNYSNFLTGGLGVGISMEENRNFITNFVEEALIDSNSYSLSLSSNGLNELILGGINKNKYVDNLTLFNFIPMVDESRYIISDIYNGYSDYYPILPITRLGVTADSTGQSALFDTTFDDKLLNSSYPRPAILDSRTYYNYIPYSTLIELALELNAYYSSQYDRWIVDCTIAESGTVDIYFGNLTINMQIQELIRPQRADNGTQLIFENGNPVCTLLFLPDYYLGHSLLGTPFLRNIYLAVDNEAKQLAIGQSSYQDQNDEDSSDNSDLYVIESGYIPFALPNNITSYDRLTMTVPSSLDTLNITYAGNVIISNGEIWTEVDTTFSGSAANSSDSSLSASGYTSSKNGSNGVISDASAFAYLFGLVIALLSIL